MILLRLLAIIVLLVVFSPACRADSLDSEAAQGCASYTTNKTGPQADGTTGHTTNLTGTQSKPPNLLPTTTMGLAPIFANGIGCTGAGFPCCMTYGCGAGEFGGCPGGGMLQQAFTPNCGGCGGCTMCPLADCVCAVGCDRSGHGTASISLPGGLGGVSISF